MTLENLHTEMPLTEDFAQPPLPAFGGRVRCRSIYAAAAMEHPVARRIIQACADAGEQARLLPDVPMKMKLADQTTAMLPLTPTGTAGALRDPGPADHRALREYFEMLWDRATPLNSERPAASGDRLPPAQQAVLELMAEGLQRRCDRPPRRASAPPRSAGTSRRSCSGSTSPAGSPQAPRRSGAAGSGRPRYGPGSSGARAHRGLLGRGRRWWRASRRC